MIIAVNGLVTGPDGECGVAGAGKGEVAKRLMEKHRFCEVSLADPMKRFCMEVFHFTEVQLWGSSEERNKEDPRYPIPKKINRWTYTCSRCGGTTTCKSHELIRCAHCSADSRAMGDCQNQCVQEYLTPRHALQQLGAEWARCLYTDTWVDYALRVAKQLEAPMSMEKYQHYFYDPACGVLDSNECEGEHSLHVVIPDVRFVNEMKAIQKAGGKVVRVKRKYKVLPGYFAGHLSETELLNEPDESFNFVLNNNGTLDELKGLVDWMMEELCKASDK